jgi:AraC-like DNA-binding protein/quercetin dioxygenase-like cupin family protein
LAAPLESKTALHAAALAVRSDMVDCQRRALYQRFVPDGSKHAFVWKYSPSFGGRRPRHFHSEPELNLVVRGTAKFGVGRRVIDVSKGELIAFPSGQDHVLLECSPDLYLYAMGLDRGYSTEALRAQQQSVVPRHVRLEARELSFVTERAAAIVDRKGADQLAAELWQRLHWLAGRATRGASGGAHVLTRRTLQLLSTTPQLSLDALSETLRAHPSEISRHFHRDLGMTLVRYRIRLRLLQVIELVDAGQHDLMAAAVAADFGSYSQCHRAFQSELGCAPRHFFRSALREQMQSTYDV